MSDPEVDVPFDSAAAEVANAIDVITADIIKNASTKYPQGHPVRDVPNIAAILESALKRGRWEDARVRAGILAKYMVMYEPFSDVAKSAKLRLTTRITSIATHAA